MPAVLVKLFAPILLAAARVVDVTASITQTSAHHFAQQGPIMVANVRSTAGVRLTPVVVLVIQWVVPAPISILTTAMECAQKVHIYTVGVQNNALQAVPVPRTVVVMITTAPERTAGARMGRTAAAIAINHQ